LNVADSRIDAPDLAQKVINSLYFSLLTGISTETGSQQSASTARQSAAQRIFLPTFPKRPSSGPFLYFDPISSAGQKQISGQVGAILSGPITEPVLAITPQVPSMGQNAD
jgi:hypothetical protein